MINSIYKEIFVKKYLILLKGILMILIMVLNFFKKMQSGEMKLVEAKELQNNIKRKTNQRKKVHWKILICFTNHKKLLLISF